MQHNQHIADLGSLLARFGISHVIVCPGSRNAPLIQLFTEDDRFHCYSIVDERSAGYVAMGMARQLLQPVAVVTTSGTAVLNLAPAMAEAWYQQIPLVVLTADRPVEDVPQFNNQVVDQQAPFFSHTKGFFENPLRIRDLHELDSALASVGALLQASVTTPMGPVHLNVPLDEPLYERLPEPRLSVAEFADNSDLYEDEPEDLTKVDPNKKILVLSGMRRPDAATMEVLEELTLCRELVVVAENIANMPSPHFISNPELILAGASKASLKEMQPDLVIAFGGQVVSKQMRLFLQGIEQLETKVLNGSIPDALQGLIPGDRKTGAFTNHYLQSWERISLKVIPGFSGYMEKAPFSNLVAVHRAVKNLPSNSILHLGNSSAIRYSQLIPVKKVNPCFSNRGTSGIDGCVSTAVGAAMVSSALHILIVGDLSFVYDSNALWNKDFPNNLKILILNDGGGGIFRMLEGPGSMNFFEEFSVTHHPVSLELLSQAFGRRFRRVDNLADLEDNLEVLYEPGSEISVLEVDTTASENSRIFKDFFKPIQ